MSSIFIRILIFFLTLIFVVVLPWWISTLVLIGLTIYFSLYIEVLFFGFLFDILYLVKSDFPYMSLSIATIFLLLVILVKTQIRTQHAL